MTLDEWEPISKKLFGAFPSASIDANNIASYAIDLEREDVRDVSAAAVFFRENGGAFPPSLPELRAQIRTERAARVRYEALPDFTGSHELPSGELEDLLLAGQRASGRGPDRAGTLDGIGTELAEAGRRTLEEGRG